MEIQWTLVLFSSIGGAGACLFAASALGELLKKEDNPSKIECIVAFILLVVGGLLSVLHLKHPDRILEALNRPTSGIFIEAALIGICCVILFIYFVMVLRNASPKARKVVAALGLIFGLVFAYACGSSYQMDARPAWLTWTLPFMYFGTALAAGTALNLLIKVFLKRSDESVRFAGLLSFVGALVGLATAALFCILSAEYIASSEHGAVAWVVALFAVLLVACVCSALAMRNPSRAKVHAVIASLCGLVAAITARVVMWLIGTPIMDLFLMPLD